jgi:NADH:ubiquinone oxidoreductase subunit D
VWARALTGHQTKGLLQMRISANVVSLTSQRFMGQTQRSVEKALQQMASGTRFADSWRRPGGLCDRREYAVANSRL